MPSRTRAQDGAGTSRGREATPNPPPIPPTLAEAIAALVNATAENTRFLREMAGQPQVTHIELPICHNEGSRPGTELLDVERVGPNRYRLLYSPGVVEGLAKGDEIEFRPADPPPTTPCT